MWWADACPSTCCGDISIQASFSPFFTNLVSGAGSGLDAAKAENKKSKISLQKKHCVQYREAAVEGGAGVGGEPSDVE